MKSTSKKGLLMSILWALVLITTVVSSVVVAQSAKAAKLYLRHNITYTAPTCIQVTFDANGGTFDPEDTIDGVYETTSVREDTYNTTIKISTLSGTSIFPTDPTRSGYTFGGWEYSVNGTSYSDYASASDMPFTDHLYVRAKWEEVIDVKLYVTGPGYDSAAYTYWGISENNTEIFIGETSVTNYELEVNIGSTIKIFLKDVYSGGPRPIVTPYQVYIQSASIDYESGWIYSGGDKTLYEFTTTDTSYTVIIRN